MHYRSILTGIIKCVGIFVVALLLTHCKPPAIQLPEPNVDVGISWIIDSITRTGETIAPDKDSTYMFLGLDSMVAELGKTELRLDIVGYPWHGGEMLVLTFSKTDTSGFVYRYRFPNENSKGLFPLKKISIKHSISWALIADTIRKFELQTLNRQERPDSIRVLDGRIYTIQFSENGKYIDVVYCNPNVYQDEQNKKVMLFLDFINRSVVPIYHTVYNENTIVNYDDR